jgi:hypothetical protein
LWWKCRTVSLRVFTSGVLNDFLIGARLIENFVPPAADERSEAI